MEYNQSVELTMEDRKGPPSQTPIYLWILAVAQVVPVVQVLGPFGPSGSVAPVWLPCLGKGALWATSVTCWAWRGLPSPCVTNS